MSKIFIEFSAGIGPLIRCLPIANELRRRGHIVKYFARDDAWKYMAQEGFELLTVDRSQMAYRRDRTNPNCQNGEEFWQLQGFDDPDWLAARQSLLQMALNEFKPDVIVADWGVMSSIAARVMGIPLVTITQSCLHPGVRAGRMRYWLPAEKTSSKTLQSINQYLTGSGIETLVKFEDIHVGTAATIIPSFPEFDPLVENWAAKTFYTGPILATGLRSPGHDASSVLDEAIDLPVVFCYTGRMNDWAGNSGEFIFHAITDALRSTPTHLIIATGGMGDDIPHLEDTGLSRVDVVDWIPMEVAYPRSRLVIHHGGHGSCMGIFQYGVPGLILPTQTEREYNARAVADLGCGSYVCKDDVNDKTIAGAVRTLLSDRTALERAQSFRSMLSSRYPNSAGHAVDIILGQTTR